MIDTQLLDDKIKKSGYKTSFLAEKLGVSRSAFYLKKENKRPFRNSEIYVLTDMLKLSEEEVTNIFFA